MQIQRLHLQRCLTAQGGSLATRARDRSKAGEWNREKERETHKYWKLCNLTNKNIT